MRSSASRYAPLAVTILLLLLLFSGCTESSLFFPDLSEEEEPAVSTVEAGSVVVPEGTIPITLPEGSEGAYSSLEITIRDATGEVVHSLVYDSVVLSEPVLPDLKLPPLEPGSYTVELVLFDQREEVAREESLFFVTSAELAVSGITLYPPTSEIEAQLIAEAHIQNSDPALDPYLRWRFRDEVVSEGLMSQEGATARLATGSESGVFTVTVELFPYAPSEGVSYELRSPTAHSTDVVVRSRGEGESVKPAEDVHLAYRFDGHGRALGRAAVEGEGDWHHLGEPVLTLRDDLFGFRIDESNGFGHGEFLFPLDEEGRLVPIRLELTLSVLSFGHGESFLLATGDGNREFILGILSDGTLSVTVDNGTEQASVVAPAPSMRSQELTTIAVELYPREAASYLVFYNGDGRIDEELVPLSLDKARAPGAGEREVPIPEDPELFRDAGASRGSLLLAGSGATFVVEELTVRALEESTRRSLPDLVASLEAEEVMELDVPSPMNEAVRYTVHLRKQGGRIYLESELDGTRSTIATLSDGSSLVLRWDNGELEYLLNGGERRRLEGEAFYFRNGETSPVADISKQSVPR